MRYPKLREIKEALRSFFSAPYTSKFPHLPHKPFERFRGRPKYYEDDCIGCGACFQVCPAKAIDMQDEGAKRKLSVRWDLCIFCGNCQANCPTGKGIMLSNEFDLATTGKREELKQEIAKDLLLCQCCGEVIAPRDQILWVANKIGPLVFSNASLMVFYLYSLSLALSGTNQDKPSLQDGPARQDRINILCPRCRREAVIKS